MNRVVGAEEGDARVLPARLPAVPRRRGPAAAHGGRPEYVGFAGDEVRWTAPRAAGNGRRSLVRRRAGGTRESLLPPPWNVRSRIVEYRGRPWAGAARADGVPVLFAHHVHRRPHAYRSGLRHAATTVRALKAGLSLYAQVFGSYPPGVPRLELAP